MRLFLKLITVLQTLVPKIYPESWVMLFALDSLLGWTQGQG
jgi:hypothetical protein